TSNVDEVNLYTDLAETEAIGTTIFNAYANISYEYNLNTDTGWMSPQATTNINRDLSGGAGGFQIEMLKIIGVNQSEWQNVVFQNIYVDPVVIGTFEIPFGFDSSDTSVGVRVRSVTSTGAQVTVAVPDYQYGTNATSHGDIYLLVVEAGEWEEAGWPKIEARNQYTDTVVANRYSSAGDQITLNTTFWGATTARFLTTVISENSTTTGSKWIESWTNGGTRSTSPSTTAFYTSMSSAEVTPQDTHPGETISYIVIEDGDFSINGLHIKSGETADTIEEQTHNNLENHNFAETPVWGVAKSIRMDDNNGGWINWEDSPFTATQIEPYQQEDRYADSEVGNRAVPVHYIITNVSTYSYSAGIDGEEWVDTNKA
ncbi:hypothetical protein LCGC14_2973120, partial [marine sediment metagenome]